MKSKVFYKNLFIYCRNDHKSFFASFDRGMNIIHGKNTSGKSTLIQAIHYTFGINDEKHKLTEILNENVIFRLDFVLRKEQEEDITIIRDNDFLYIKRENKPLEKFSGISGNTSKEHIQLKEYLADLFGFNLQLESKDEYKQASLEAMFLPYYVAQDLGWVSTLKSFRGLEFFRNFKIDYYDYYLGIFNGYDRLEKQKLENEKKDFENQIKSLKNIETKKELQLTTLKDETFILKAREYIDLYKINKKTLIEKEKEYLLKCNEIVFNEQKLIILNKIKKALNEQSSLKDKCPTCKQEILYSIADIYNYFQNVNDTDKQIDSNQEEIKKLKSKINSLQDNTQEKYKDVSRDYEILCDYKVDDLTFGTWLDNKTNAKLVENIARQIHGTEVNLSQKKEELKKFKTDEEVKQARNTCDYGFQKDFKSFLQELKVQALVDDRDTLLYGMGGVFPKQGVELLKTMLSYYFAFNKIIKQTDYVHRFPLMLDAIFKEDIDEDNRKLILQFIYKNKPQNEQIIFSIADSKNNTTSVEQYNRSIMCSAAQLISTDLDKERSLLKPFDEKQQSYLDETLKLLEQ